MPVTIEIKTDQASIQTALDSAVHRVLDQFANQFPDFNLLCFFDDDDWQPLKDMMGPATRGFYAPIKEQPFECWPSYLTERIFVVDPNSHQQKRTFDHLIYVFGSTCVDEIGLTMTFAHEVQHFLQYGYEHTLWAENSLLPHLPKEVIGLIRLKWFDIPIEREARVAAKRIAEDLFGADQVRLFIDRRIGESVTAEDAEDWKLIQLMDPLVPYNLANETRAVFQRVKHYRPELEAILRELRNDEDFKDMDLDTLCESPSTDTRRKSAGIW